MAKPFKLYFIVLLNLTKLLTKDLRKVNKILDALLLMDVIILVNFYFRNLEKELRDIKLKLKEAKYYKTTLKEEALTTETNLRNKIDKLKSQIEEKTKENTKLMNKDTKQLKKSLIKRMEKKTANVKRKMKKKVIRIK